MLLARMLENETELPVGLTDFYELITILHVNCKTNKICYENQKLLRRKRKEQVSSTQMDRRYSQAQ
jgi:hypothetical protein